MTPFITVIVCTHNPRVDYLGRVLDSLKTQNLAEDQWELLLIDNASLQPLASRFDISWHSTARHIREDELGLTPARLRGIRESKGELIVFVDDDNVLASDYLQSAVQIAEDHAFVGAFGASIKGEFEIPPPAWISPYLCNLAVQEIGRDYWSNAPTWNEATPYGAGLCVRRRVAELYLQEVQSSVLRRALDRVGTQLGGCGDIDLAWCAIDLGMGTARFSKLRLTHLIPARRLTKEYIVRLRAEDAGTEILLRSLRSLGDNPGTGRDQPRPSAAARALNWTWRFLRTDALNRRIMLKSRKARERAQLFVARAGAIH